MRILALLCRGKIAPVPDLLDKVKRLQESAKARSGKKRPRHYAEEIMQLKTKDERKAALELVPEEIRHIVKFYVASAFAKRTGGELPEMIAERQAIQSE